MHGGFAPPEVKVHVEIGVVFLHIRDGYFDDLVPESAESPVAFLQAVRVGHGFRVIVGVLFGAPAGSGIDLLQFRDGKRRFRGILSGKSGVKIAQIRLSFGNFRDDKAHLQPPVAEVNVSDDVLAVIARDALYSFADDGAAEVSHMERLGHIGSAVVQDDRCGLFRELQSELLFLPHLCEVGSQKLLPDPEIQKAGLYGFHGRKDRGVRELRGYVRRDHDRCFMVSFGAGHRPVALVFAQIGTVRDRDLAEFPVIACGFKSLRHFFGNLIEKFFHCYLQVCVVIENDYIVKDTDHASADPSSVFCSLRSASLLEKAHPQKFCL